MNLPEWGADLVLRCELCGHEADLFTKHHMETAHGLTQAEYCLMFPQYTSAKYWCDLPDRASDGKYQRWNKIVRRYQAGEIGKEQALKEMDEALYKNSHYRQYIREKTLRERHRMHLQGLTCKEIAEKEGGGATGEMIYSYFRKRGIKVNVKGSKIREGSIYDAY